MILLIAPLKQVKQWNNYYGYNFIIRYHKLPETRMVHR